MKFFTAPLVTFLSIGLFSFLEMAPFAHADDLPNTLLGSEDDAFLDQVERASWTFFNDEWNPQNGLIPDRSGADGTKPGSLGSIASVGFGLTGLCLADSHGWIARDEAVRRVLVTLRTFRYGLDNKNGFFYHFYIMKDARLAANCDVSPIDTTLFLVGAITARDYFNDPEITRLVNEIYGRVDWTWMLDSDKTLRLAWSPEKGFYPYRWDEYSELMAMYLLGMGSPTHPLPPDCWRAWKRTPVETYYDYKYISFPALFAHQYSQAYFDFRDRNDGYADYFLNSRYATLAQRQMCMDLSGKFPGWGPDIWGITASDSGHGYRVWGGPPVTDELDGTFAPCAPGGSLPFAPQECVAALRTMKQRYGDKIWRKYGFVDAFNPVTGWADWQVIGIDVGITMVQTENARTGSVWKWFMQAPEAQRAMHLAGFQRDSTFPSNSSLVLKSPGETAFSQVRR